ncbi:MAG: 30S ribosomal protein S20 [Comamonadaceae bacterium]|nr:30S ribosomal protein S20 [Comamonadaceae bacterium]
MLASRRKPLAWPPRPKPRRRPSAIASGRKRARQDVKLNAAQHARCVRDFRTVVKNVQKAVAGGDKAKASRTVQGGPERHRLASPTRGIFHKNKAARQKSRLSAKVKALAA